MRLINSECSVNNWNNVAGMSPEVHEDKKEEMLEYKKQLEDMDFIFVEGYGKTHQEIFSIIEKLNVPIDAVFIDYVQMISSGGKNDKQAIDEYIKKLRNYAIKNNLCFVIGSQINRGTHDGGKIKKPEMWELKGSGALEEIMDMCFLVHWQHYYTKEKDIFNDYWIKVAKNREGKTGIFECKYEPEFYRITEGVKDERGYTNASGEEGSTGRGAYNDR